MHHLNAYMTYAFKVQLSCWARKSGLSRMDREQRGRRLRESTKLPIQPRKVCYSTSSAHTTSHACALPVTESAGSISFCFATYHRTTQTSHFECRLQEKSLQNVSHTRCIQ